MSLESEIRAQLPRAAEAMTGLSADQINWRPAEGSWSIAECIAHMNTLNGMYAGSIDNAIRDGRRHGLTSDAEARLGLFERIFLRITEPPYRIKFKAPSKLVPRTSMHTFDGLLDEWTSTHERLARLAHESQGLDLKRVKVPSPVSPLLKGTLLLALKIPPAHDRRHLWQAGRVRQMLVESNRSAG